MLKNWVFRGAAPGWRYGLAAALLLLAVGVHAQVRNAKNAAQAQPIAVVASFSVLGEMVDRIGGEHIALTTLIGPGGDAHSYEPTPEDAKALAGAQLLFLNGLGFESWMPRLLKSSGFDGVQVVVSEGVEPRSLAEGGHHHGHDDDHGHGDDHGHADDHEDTAKGDTKTAHDHAHVDPHAWQSLGNGMIYAQNIGIALAKADPPNAFVYMERTQAYITEMKKLDVEIRQALKQIPEDRRTVVTSHDSFGYFEQDYGVRFISIMGPSSEAEPSARDLAAIIKTVREQNGVAVFVENVANPKLVQQIARETNAMVGDTLFSDALGQPDEPAGTYLGMFKWNAGQLIYALSDKSLTERN